jgi:hypothetical protein
MLSISDQLNAMKTDVETKDADLEEKNKTIIQVTHEVSSDLNNRSVT